MLPPVSEPSAATTWLAATAEAEPPLLPPGTRSGSHGLWVGCTERGPGRGACHCRQLKPAGVWARPTAFAAESQEPGRS